MDTSLNEPQRDRMETEHFTAALFTAYISGFGLTGIVQTAASLLRNPVIVFDASFRIVAHSGHEDMDDYIWSENIRRGYCSYDFIAAVNRMDSVRRGKQSDASYEVACEETANTKLISKIKVGGKQIGNVLLLGCRQPFRPLDRELLSLTATVLAEEMGKSSYYRNARNIKVEDILCGLLEQQLQDSNTIQERLQSAGLRLGDTLLVLLFDLTGYVDSGRYDDYLSERLQHLFPGSPCTYYEGRIVLIHNGSLARELVRGPLQEFLSSAGVSLGISSSFSSLKQCRLHYLQALSALRIGRILCPERKWTYYADIQLYELLPAEVLSGEERLYRHPELWKLQEYDAAHQSSLYHTFYVYLKHNRNMQLASEELYIHRNTLRYKLDHISRLLEADFTDSEKMLAYYISYKIADFCEKAREQQIPLPVR
ncbi:helix-turn-helix domain-containing protein [Paenibacillus sp. MMS20-IR301]|uniref:PucR family transcriptional regulator n=1 Tax=Paenibacillus sp. MMS20-IR301 TaxID=2895946 RepID=UPI0028E31DC4|nr:helix-turn-helix domain-containing protein [Paenibacillus sp. MMS20-IR301]WNS41388.1 helix-turn-helix domain-containing protein [Paenibacillus sp. MMS20-IR301]